VAIPSSNPAILWSLGACLIAAACGDPTPTRSDENRGPATTGQRVVEPPGLEFVEEPMPAEKLEPLALQECGAQHVQIGDECRLATPAAIASIEACGRGVAIACVEVGHRLNMGEGTASNVRGAARAYTRACRAGEVEGCFWKAFFLIHGKAGKKDVEAGRELAIRSKWPAEQDCGEGKAGACRALSLLLSGRYGIPQDTSASASARLAARKRWSDDCEAGEGRACMNARRTFGMLDEDDGSSAALLRKGCEHGDLEGCLAVAKSISKGEGGYARDAGDARARLDQLCSRGSPMACRLVSRMYEAGEGGPANPNKAAESRARACAGGLTGACEPDRP
jgi:hypothetical protein